MSKPSAPRSLASPGWIVALSTVVAAAVLSTLPAGLHWPSPAVAAAPSPASTLVGQPSRVRANLGNLPLGFEANQGQSDPRVKYMARGDGYTLFLTASEAVFALRSSSRSATADQDEKYGLRGAHQILGRAAEINLAAAIHMQLAGGRQARISAGGELPGRTNYFIGDDPGRWHTNVAQYARVSYGDVYPGVTLAFYGVHRQLEFDFIVAPGANPAPIRLAVSGAERIATDNAGNLLLSSLAGDVRLHKPVAYQETNGARRAVDARFVLRAGNQVGFELGAYDRNRELVIDPSVSYATYLGGTGNDDGNAIAIDHSGNAYIAGQTASTDFPTVAVGHSATNAGGLDVFVTKISADGSTLIYSTYVGGSGGDSGNAIAVDSSGNAFVAGVTASSANFPHTGRAFQTSFGGGSLDAFAFELNSAGSGLTYSTYLGGTGDDAAAGIALDGAGNTYIAGATTSTDFPTTSGVVQPHINGTSNGFVTKLNSSGTALGYSTYLGGGTGDFVSAVALDSLNQAYVTGATQNPAFPTTASAFQKTCGSDGTCNGGLDDAFVTVFKADGSGFVYSTLLGGENADQGFGIVADSDGDAYVTGSTASSAHFPLKSAIQSIYGGDPSDAFVTALNPAGSALLYSTYLGGSLNDTGTGIAIDAGRNVYLTGQTGSSDFPVASATQGTSGGGNDAFVTEINSTGSQFVFSTYLGGSLDEDSILLPGGNLGTIGAIAVDSAGANLYVTGDTSSTDFPTHLPHQLHNAGLADAFVARYAQANFSIAATALNPALVNPGGDSTSTITVGALNGFSSSVALTCAVSPATANPPTCGFNPASVNPGTPSTLTLTTTASTAPAIYTIAVTGTSGGFAHTAAVSLSVQDFSIAATPLSPASVNPGSSATSTVTAGALNGFSNAVTLTCSVSPTPANSPTCSFIPAAVSPGTPSTLTVMTPAATPGGVYTVTVTGTYAADVHSTTVSLTVNGFLISATPPAAVNAGSSSTSTVTLTALNGYNLPVTLSCSVAGPGSPLPACNAQSFSTNPVTPTAQSVLTITTTPPAKAGVRRGTIRPATWLPVLGISLVGVWVSVGARRKKLAGSLLIGLVMIALFLMPSCGGSGGCSAIPSAPTGLMSSATTNTGTTLNWNAPTAVGAGNCGALTYTIYQNGSQIGTGATTNFNVTGLSPSTTYSFTVSASDKAGPGPQSSPLTVTTTSGATPAGNYTITITGTDANNLSNSAQVTLTVN